MEEKRRQEEARRHEIRRETDCGECGEHKVWEERLKILDVIPTLAKRTTWNMAILSMVGLLFALLISVVNTSRSEMSDKQNNHEVMIKEQQTELSDQVKDIVKNVNNIDRNVAVILKALELDKIQAAKERAENREAIRDLQRQREESLKRRKDKK